MGTEIPNRTLDAVIEALAADDQDRAILLYHRASGKDLAEAWAAVH